MSSSAFQNIDYDPERGTLSMTFAATGQRYRHYGVPIDAYEALRYAYAKGTVYNRRIRPHYEWELVSGHRR